MNDAAVQARVDTLLGCSRAAGPRRILGLGDGPVDGPTLEAALTSRLRLVESSAVEPSVQTGAATRLRAAAAALRGTVLETRGDAAPIAPARMESPVRPSTAASRRVPPRRPNQSVATPTPPEGPIAGLSRPVKPVPQITAEHLTPFDRLVLSILVAGGGWNARTRVLVAGLADQEGLDSTRLKKIVIGLAGFMRQQGVAGTFDEMSRAQSMPSATAALPTPGRVEAVLGRVSDGVGREFRGESTASRNRLVAIFVIIAVLFGSVLVIALTAPSPQVRDIERQRVADEEARAEELAGEAPLDPDHLVTPSVRPGIVRPTQWDRPPMFRGDPSPSSLVLEIEGLPVLEDDLERLGRDLELDPGRPGVASLARWDHAVETISTVWPLLDVGRRAELVRGLVDVLRWAQPPETAERLVATLDVDLDAAITDSLDGWRRGFRSGVLGVVVLDDSLPDTVRAEARRIVQAKLAGSNGRHARGGPFAALAGRALDSVVDPLIAITGVEDDRTVGDAWERWFDAQEAIRSGAGLQQALLLAVSQVLSDGRGLGINGMSSDVLGRLVGEIDWSALGPDPTSVREAYRTWFEDPQLNSEATWVLASLLEGPRGIGWFRSEFVPDPALGLDGRAAALGRTIADWPAARLTVASGEVVPTDPQLLERIDQLLPEVRMLITAARTPVERLAAALSAERLALAATLLADERTREAEAEIGRVILHVQSGDSGIDLDPRTSPMRRSNDGAWAEAWKKAARDENRRMALLDSLRLDLASGDLGPLDAATLVTEAWRGRSGVRDSARSIVLELFRRGPTVATRMIDTLGIAPLNSDTLEFIEQYTGTPLPERSSEELDSMVRLAMVAHAVSLLDPQAEVVDRFTRELGETVHARARARIRASDGDAGRWDGRPETAAVLAADAMRREAAGLFLAIGSESTIEAIDRRRAARRRLATDDVLRLVAAHAAETDYLAFALEARVPGRRRVIEAARQAAGSARAEASSGLEQIGLAALALVELERVRMVPRDSDPLGGAG
ncbi:MAG: hypothetical protein GY895_05315 [Phycisphaera sp.]|nr:hypothetical protein [Phycisphaera sp.]